MIRFEHIAKTFKDKTVLENISFTIHKGQLVVIIGASGCGKTTLLKMINRLLKPTSGQIFINDEEISGKNIINLRRSMGYVIQQTGLFPHMTIRENIEIISKLDHKNETQIKERTLKLMDMVGLNPTEYLDRYPTELSGGQQQRVGVARAFATDPEIILMDEPFSALDPITRTGLQDELINIQSQLKKTIVFVTHDMDEAIKIADMICIMDKGKVLQYDTPENILKNPCNAFVSTFIGKNRIWASPEFIKAKDIMIDTPVTCLENFSLLTCAEIMRSSKVDSLMIVENKSKKLLGIVRANQIRLQTDRSILVKNLMITDFLSVRPDDTIVDVLKAVDENIVSSVPVVSDAGILAGLITKSSLVTTLSQQYLNTEEASGL